MSTLAGTAPRIARGAILILLAAAAIRILPVIWGFRPIENSDAVDYREFGRGIAEGKGYGYVPGNRGSLLAALRDRDPYPSKAWVPTAFRPPGYPLFLGAVYVMGFGSMTVLLLQALLGVWTVLMLYRAAQEIASERAAQATAAVAAVYPFFVYFCLQEISESLFIAILCTLIRILLRKEGFDRVRWIVLAGVLQGWLILVRPQGLFPLPAVLILLWISHEGKLRARSRALATYAGAAALVMIPWMVRNAVVLGGFVPLSTLGGFNFWMGNAYLGEHGSHLDFPWTTLGGTLPSISGMSEPDVDRFYYARAWDFILAHPGRALWGFGVKLGDLWRPAPHAAFFPTSYLLVSWVATLSLFGLALAGAIRREIRRPAFLFLSLAVVLATLLSAVHLPLTRHRIAGIDPFLMILAASGIDRAISLLDRIRRGRDGSGSPSPSSCST